MSLHTFTVFMATVENSTCHFCLPMSNIWQCCHTSKKLIIILSFHLSCSLTIFYCCIGQYSISVIFYSQYSLIVPIHWPFSLLFSFFPSCISILPSGLTFSSAFFSISYWVVPAVGEMLPVFVGMKMAYFTFVVEEHFLWLQKSKLAVTFFQHLEYIIILSSDLHCLCWEVTVSLTVSTFKVIIFLLSVSAFLKTRNSWGIIWIQ